MKIDIYHLYRHLDYAVWGYPLMIDVLKVWAESIGWQVNTKVCQEARVNFDSDADVVAFSVYTQTAPMTYRISRRFRQQGKIVILGGPHFRGPTYVEGMEHCDVMVHSICREQWLDLLREIEQGNIQPGSDTTGNCARVIMDKEHRFRYPDNFYETFKHMRLHHLTSIPTSLGCPYHCSFCNPFMQGKYFVRDIDIIYNEFFRSPKFRPLFLADASTGLNKQHTIELMKTVAPLKRNILMESTVNRLQDPEILDALAEGGVKWITVGLESFNWQLEKLGKGKLEDNINRLLDNAHERGMMVEGNFIIGLDSDGPGVFDEIYEFYVKSSLDIIIIDLLTPYPNTKLFDDMQRQGRIIDTNWEHYDYHHLVYRPKQMSEQQLIDGFVKLYNSLYSTGMVFKNVTGAFSRTGIGSQALGVLIYNTWAWYDARRKKKALNINKSYINKLLQESVV
jgi:radical SAM superfamily enzyme YgiQ (UPF0313 family)